MRYPSPFFRITQWLDIEPPELGEALPEFERALAWAGHCVLKSTFETKETMINLTYGESTPGEAEGGNLCNVGIQMTRIFPVFVAFALLRSPV
jgi:hypothetical protein